MEMFLAVFSIVVSVISIVISVVTYTKTLDHDRKQDTLEAYNRLQTEVFDKLNLYTVDEICEICKDKKSQEYNILVVYLARIEHFCVGMNEKIYDKGVFVKLSKKYFTCSLKKRIIPILKTRYMPEDNYKYLLMYAEIEL